LGFGSAKSCHWQAALRERIMRRPAFDYEPNN
jgi:hypothetical protein